MLSRLDLPPVFPVRKTDGNCITPRDYMARLERVERASRAAEPLPDLPNLWRYLLRDIRAHRKAAR